MQETRRAYLRSREPTTAPTPALAAPVPAAPAPQLQPRQSDVALATVNIGRARRGRRRDAAGKLGRGAVQKSHSFDGRGAGRPDFAKLLFFQYFKMVAE